MRALPRAATPRHTLPPLEALLVAGGDTRLTLDPATGLNQYGCRPLPRPEAMNFSAATASSISDRAFARALRLRRALENEDVEAAAALTEAARASLAAMLGIGTTGAEIVFAPSGTDAALLALAVARSGHGEAIISIIAAADETGRGMLNACCGRHFAAVTAQGRAVVAGTAIAGLGTAGDAVAVKLRDAAGRPRPPEETDRGVLTEVAAIVAAGHRALLYAMDHSKLGNRCPSDACLDAIDARFGAAVTVVVDACQARLGRGRMHFHLERGRMMLVTGSKFYGGPPLSGALLVPPHLAMRMADSRGMPPALRDYSVATDWPRGWTKLRAGFGGCVNLGQLLRWEAALAEMRAFYAMPEAGRSAALAAFAAAVPRAMAPIAALELLPDAAEVADGEFPVRTIFPFALHRAGRRVAPELAGKLYLALNVDVSSLLPQAASRAERHLAALCCHIGQPVAVPGADGPYGVLRVSASAPLVVANEAPEPMLRLVFAKLALLLDHIDAVERAF
ncbi:MAG TPA: hypothetical protein VMU87_14980 [Stellaceae bacterium]|nr:hypothetical protein [Stellaceae bacterium]